MNVTSLGNTVFADDEIKMRSLGWPLSQNDWYPYEKDNFGHRNRHTEWEDNVKRYRKRMAIYKPRNSCGYRKAGERPETRSSLVSSEAAGPAYTLILDL